MSEIDLTSPEVKAAIAEARAEAVAEATEGLRAKNAELLGKLKRAQKDSAIDPADLERAEAERDEWKGKAQAAEKAVKKATTDLEAANKRATDTETAFHGSLRDAQLTEALTKAGVTPALLKAAKALHGSALQVVDENGAKVVKAGDKALGDYITTWAGSDEGKHFIASSQGGGGGSNPASRGTNSNAPSVTRQAFEGMSPAAQHEHIVKNNGVVTDA
ncbi:MAG: hypothetical protein J7507_12095 [Pseudoxanthomonas sp.]|nr:hypothetical protein [Pseudoxanthomonas sp.]